MQFATMGTACRYLSGNCRLFWLSMLLCFVEVYHNKKKRIWLYELKVLKRAANRPTFIHPLNDVQSN